jgi:hypothetical protein
LKFTASNGTETISFCEENRAPSGHPAGFIEAFANIYRDCASKIQGENVEVINEKDGLASMKFVNAALLSKETQAWSDV